MSDEELDRLFKASAENFDPPFDPEAWAAMDQKLEKVQVRHRWFRRFYPFVSLVLLISLVTIYQLVDKSEIDFEPTFSKTQQKQELAQIKETEALEAKSQKKQKQQEVESIPSLNDTETITAESNSQVASDSKTASSIEVIGEVPINKVFGKHQEEKGRKEGNSGLKVPVAIGLGRDHKQKESWRPREPRSRRESKISSGSVGRESNLALGIRRSTMTIADENGLDEEKATLELLEHRAISIAPRVSPVNLTLQLISLDSAPNSQNSEVPMEGAGPQKSTPAFLSYIQVALAVAPDVTTVKFKNPDAVSANAGILLGVPLTHKLSLVSGVVWANKMYSANADDYYFSNGYTYTEPVDATCKVIDIPINLQYRLFGNEKNTLAIQAGLSSYLMLSEKYTSGGYYPYHNEVSNENQHWFKVQNVSLMYSRTISPVFSFGVEPFVKIPYGGIGDGKVKLTSAGVFFSAGYRIKLKP
ncbi:hypothetical protein [Rufibacter aurantiacus]|uniref:hypothetical protein n=1 Tax=Rufibacter aurantiacus TaxID=2817374 RepID=UPI001B3035D6|nr:hypothetical protein [Rufibacter aurantiacus]